MWTEFLTKFSTLFSTTTTATATTTTATSSSTTNSTPPPAEQHFLVLPYIDNDFSCIENFVKIYEHLGIKLEGDKTNKDECFFIPDGVTIILSGSTNDRRLSSLLLNTFSKYPLIVKQPRMVLISDEFVDYDVLKDYKKSSYQYEELFVFDNETNERPTHATQLMLSCKESLSPFGQLRQYNEILHFSTKTLKGSQIFVDVCKRPGLSRVEIISLANQHGASPNEPNQDGNVGAPIIGATVFKLNGICSQILGKIFNYQNNNYEVRSVDVERSQFLLQSSSRSSNKIIRLPISDVRDHYMEKGEQSYQILLDDLLSAEPKNPNFTYLKNELQIQAGKANVPLKDFINQPSDALTQVLSKFLVEDKLHNDVYKVVEFMYLATHKKALTQRVINAVTPQGLIKNSSNHSFGSK